VGTRALLAGVVVGSITAVMGTVGVAAADDDELPSITNLRFTPKALKPGGHGEFRFLTARSGALTVTISRQTGGRKAGSRCVAAKRAPAGAKPCQITVTVGKLRSSVDVGEGLRRFDGTIDGRALAPGRYRAGLTVTSAGTGVSPPAYVAVRIVAK
jgi:hypothetical protein